MKCPKCGKEFSEPIIEFHIERCKGNEKKKKTDPKKENKTPKK